MKKLLIGLLALGSITAFAENEDVLKGSRTNYSECSMAYGYAVDSDNLTLIQSKDVFFRIQRGNGDFYPSIVITNTDEKGIAHSNPVSFGAQDCYLMKRCIDKFASNEVSVAATCTSGTLKVKFIKN